MVQTEDDMSEVSLSKPNKRNKRKKSDKDDDDVGSSFCSKELKERMMSLIQSIMRKDIHMIFAEPVSDSIAPGYSSIILHPMDLSTMQKKVQRGEYTSLRELKKDADVMCQNCMVYNADDTIFYKEAVKIQNFINSLFGEKKSKSALVSNIQEGLRKKQELQEEWEAEEIAESVKKAAKLARERLDAEAPDTRVGYLSQDNDNILLNIINAPPGEPTQKPVDMNYFKQHPDTATSLLHNFKEKRRVSGKPVQYLHYGPFGSFAPTYDSVFASLDKEEQELLYRCYGDELGLSYCRSVQEFARGAADSLRSPVESIINSLTGGGHTRANRDLAQKYAKILRDRRLIRSRRMPMDCDPIPAAVVKEAPNESPVKTEPTSESQVKVEPPEDDAEELSLLKLLEADKVPDIIGDPELYSRLEAKVTDSALQAKLNKTGELLTQLHEEQTQRLTVPPEQKKVSPATENEHALAQKVRENLTDMIKSHVPGPDGVVSQAAARESFTSDLTSQLKPA